MSALDVNNKKSITVTIIIIFVIVIFLAIFYNLLTKPKINTISPTPIPTIILPTLTQQEIKTETEEVSKSDENWGKKSQEVVDAYPWLDQLPLNTDQYFVYFDINKKIFIAKIFNKEIEKTKTEISNELTKKGVDVSKYLIDWKILP